MKIITVIKKDNIWESNAENANENKLLFLFNDVNGNLIDLSLKIDVDFE